MRHMLLLAVLILATLTLTTLIVVRSLVQQRSSAQIITLAAAAEEAVERALDAARLRTAVIGGDARIARVFDPAATQTASAEALAAVLHDTDTLSGLAIYDADGAMRASAGTLPSAATIPATATSLAAVTGRSGWEWIDVSLPVGTGSGSATLAARYDTRSLLRDLQTSLRPMGDSAQLAFAREENGTLTILPVGAARGTFASLDMGETDALLSRGLPIARAVRGEEFVGMGSDYRGERALSASRYLPSLGWGLVVQVDSDEVMSGIRWLGMQSLIIGAALILLAAALAYLLAHELTRPLQMLTTKVGALGPGNWSTRRSIDTGDEVETLDVAFTDMATRLERLYNNLEEEVRARTAELHEEYTRKHTILETIEYGVVMSDANGSVVEANPTAARLLGVEAASVIGTSAADLLPLTTHDAALTGPQHPVTQCLATGAAYRSPHSARISLLRPHGDQLPVFLQTAPILVGGHVVGAVTVFQDMSDERQVDYMKSEFISLASHQLRTPLSALRWYLELFQEETAFNAEQKDYLAEMQTSVGRMVNLLNALLRAAKLEEKGIVPDWQETDVCALVQESGEELQTLATAAGVLHTVSVPPQPCTITTDVTLLSIVLQNLCGNAVKYSRKGGTVALSLATESEGVRIEVRDNGMGIPSAEHQRIFEKFFRATNVRKMDTDGNGLGLHISKEIIARLNGQISFSSEENVGTTFTVTLPLRGGTPVPPTTA